MRHASRLKAVLTPTGGPRARVVRGARVGVVSALGLFANIAPTQAVTLFQKSVYTSLDLKHCEALKNDGDGMTYRCEGLPGVPIYFAEGDDRTFLSAGPALDKAKAASQTLKSFNSVFARPASRATIEWRFVIKERRKVPYAMIVRYFTQRDGAKGQVLVVSRIADQASCHVAYIDATANPDAIVLARKIADERAPHFDCAQPASIEGRRGKSPM
jgi:hypothetical protein